MEKLDIAKIEEELKPLLKHKSYNAFVQHSDSYKYAEIINKIATYCLYCNINSIETIRKSVDKKGERMSFDHFVRKNDDVDNDLNCYNLIPSCHICNSNYKGANDCDDKILNPFLDNFNELAQFDINLEPDQLGKFADSNICIDVITKDDNLLDKTIETIKVFNLQERYNSKNTKDDLKDFFRNLKYLTSIKEKDYNLIGLDSEFMKDFVSDIKDCPINKKRYGKLKKDIFKKYSQLNNA